MFWKRYVIRDYEKGLFFHEGQYKGLLHAGRYRMFDPLNRKHVEVVDMRDPWLVHQDLDVIVRSSGVLDILRVLDLSDDERALVWVDGRFTGIVAGCLAALWTTFCKVKVEVVDARQVRFNHADTATILKHPSAKSNLEEIVIAEEHAGVMFQNGQYVQTLPAGRYVFWKGVENVKIKQVNLAELTLDVSGQEIMTADKVTLRLNAVATYRVDDAARAVRATEDARQALYRQVQLALRAVIGQRELDTVLTDKDGLVEELAALVAPRAVSLGLAIVSLGIRDVILPGEMKELLNRVTEARKAAEANLIARREETAAMRSQANTAKLLENNPALMRLRELEVLEKIAGHAKLNVVLGEKGLADRVVNLL